MRRVQEVVLELRRAARAAGGTPPWVRAAQARGCRCSSPRKRVGTGRVELDWQRACALYISRLREGHINVNNVLSCHVMIHAA